MSKRDIDARMRVLDAGLIACYEIIDRIRKEQAELKQKSAQPPQQLGPEQEEQR